MDDFNSTALAHAARAAPGVVFDALVTALCEYADTSFEHSGGDLPIPDAAGTGRVLSSATMTINLSEDDDTEDTLDKVHDCTYPDGAKAIHLPRETIVLVRRGSTTTLIATSR